MTLQHFKALSLDRQRTTVLKKGVFLSDRKTGTFCIMLFQLDGLYIEVFFLNENDEILWIKCFDSTDALDPYLPQIDLSKLVN